MAQAKSQKRPPQAKRQAEDQQTQDKSTKNSPAIETGKRDRCLSHEDAMAASPADAAVVGEEDPGIGVEFLVRESEDRAREDR